MGPLALRMRALAGGALVSMLAAACAPIPTPHVLGEADAVAASPAASDAKTYAPSAFAAAEKLRKQAHDALEHDRQAHAQILAERAIAAYEEAASLARVARAEHRLEEAGAKKDAAQKELESVQGEVSRAQADVDGLELQLKVVKDAQAIRPSGPAGPEREAARKDAARAMLVQARLLCAAAHVFTDSHPSAPTPLPTAPAPSPPEADSLKKDLSAADADLAKLATDLEGTGATPIDLATRTRATCLSLLGRARRESPSAAPATSSSSSSGAEGDALLGELSAFASRVGGGLSPERDERGVVVTLRSVFEGDKLGASARSRLEELDRVAAAHPRFAVAIVLHSDVALKKGEEARWSARGDEISGLFQSVPKERIVKLVAGNFSPVVDPHGRDRVQNARVEIIFVPPEP
jgi:hypothetical protein